MGFGRLALSAAGKVGIVLAVLVAFTFGLLGTIYLSLRTAEVKVPDVLGKDRLTAETMLDDAGLKIRIRGARPSVDKQPDTILSQLPEAGQIVKAGIPVAVEVSRSPKEGEYVPSTVEDPTQESAKPAENSNNSNQSTTATNQNQNQNKAQKNKNTNKNANNKNANNSNNANRNSNTNRNANSPNTNAANRNANNGNRNTNTTPNANRSTNNPDTNRRAPVITTPPFNPGANRGTP